MTPLCGSSLTSRSEAASPGTRPMSVENFLDTNIIVYSFDAMAPAKANIAQAFIGKSLREWDGAISWQVVQEFCNLALRKFVSPMTASECALYARKVLFPLCKVWPSESLYSEALELVGETGYSYLRLPHPRRGSRNGGKPSPDRGSAERDEGTVAGNRQSLRVIGRRPRGSFPYPSLG